MMKKKLGVKYPKVYIPKEKAYFPGERRKGLNCPGEKGC
jgi:hypothetical protein